MVNPILLDSRYSSGRTRLPTQPPRGKHFPSSSRGEVFMAGKPLAGKRGDRIIVESEQVGTPSREGEVLEVIAGSVRVAYRVRWADGHESVFTPSVGSARILASKRKR